MPLIEIPEFITDGPVGNQLPVNLYWEPDSQYGQPILASTPGLVATTGTMGTGTIRNMLSFNNVLYGVSDDKLYSWAGSSTATEQGSGMNTTIKPYWVSMAINYDSGGAYELAITDRSYTRVWHYNISTDTFTYALTPYVGASRIVPTNITYLKQVFVIGQSGGNRMYCSGIDSATSWSELNFSSKTAKPDRIMGVIAVNQDLWVLGETSTEIWYYTGASSGFPFALMSGAVLDVGCWSMASAVVMDGSLYWLNDRAEVCKSSGYSYEVISPPYLNDILQGYAASSYTYVANAVGYAIQWEGHPWYVLTLPSVSKTYVFDGVGRAAGQRGWFEWRTGTGRHLSSCSALLFGDWICGSYTGGGIYYLSDTIYTDNGANNYRIKYCPVIYGGGELARLRQFVLQGSFPATGDGYYLRLTACGNSTDAMSLTSPVKWSGLGSGTTITPYITYYGSGNVEMHKAFADLSVGRRR